MRSGSKTIVLLLFAPVLSGTLLVLAFSNTALWWLPWLGLAPLFLSLLQVKPWQAFLLSFLCGATYFALFFLYMFEIPSYTVVHHILLDLYLSIFVALFGFIFCFLSRRCGMPTALVAAPFLWISFEFIRSNLGFLAHPAALLGYSQLSCLPLIQISAATGVYGVSFLVVLANAGIAAVVLLLWQGAEGRSPGILAVPRDATVLVAVLAGIVIISALAYGNMVLSKPISGKPIKVSIVQGNIEQGKKWDPAYAEFIMRTYVDLSRAASHDHPELIVWPEAATPGFVLKNMSLLQQITSLAKETKCYYLIGSSEYGKFDKRSIKKRRVGNTALFFSPNGKVLGQYVKIHLVPFGEYVPLEGIVSWPDFIIPEGKKSFELGGKEFTLFDLHGTKFGAFICWENLFPYIVRGFVKKGAQFVVNMTNEAWFGKSSGAYRFLTATAFRAVENRVYVVRCANTGVSCFIDPYGRILDRVRDASGRDLFVRGVLTRNIVPMNSGTVYTRYGDWFPWLALLISAAALIIAFVRKRAGSRSRIQDLPAG
jgi:apolipoprotein N-acyltransferase